MLVIVTLMSFGVSAAFADEPEGGSALPPLAGSGTLEKPFELSTCEDLQRINENTGSNYIIVNHIDCSNSAALNEGQGFQPITQFTGRYIDGRNFTINDLTINGSSQNVLGFINNIQAGSIVRNINFQNLTVTNSDTSNPNEKITGGVAAVNDGIIDNIWLQGTITSAGFVGAVAGTNSGSISRVTSYLGVNGTSATEHTLGGIAGYSEGTISDVDVRNVPSSYEAQEATCGGVVGYMNGGSVSNAITQGVMSCNGNSNSVGGIAGYSAGAATVTNSAVSAETNWNVPLNGAIIGHNSNGADLSSNVYNLSKVVAAACDDSGNTSCVGVNDQNSDPNYFINNITNAPFSSWDFTTNWLVNAEDTPSMNWNRPITHLVPLNVNVTTTPTSVTYSWTDPRFLDANTTPSVDQYEIIVADDSSKFTMFDTTWSQVATVPGNQYTYTVENLDLNTQYVFRLRALNSAGAGTPTYPHTIKPVPAKQSTPTASNAVSRAVQIDWEDPNDVANAYTVQYKKTSSETWNTYTRTEFPTPSSVVYPLDENTSYDFRVSATNERGVGEYSDVFTTSTPAQAAYEISSCEELQNINEDLFANYVLTGDIDCTESAEWNDGAGFVPLGQLNDDGGGFPFAGSLDGAGHEITNLYMNRPGQMAGLFLAIDGATIENLEFNGGNISGLRPNEGNVYTDQVVNPLVGTVAVFAANSSIDNVKSNIDLTGDILNGQNGGAGGLVGLVMPSVFGPGTNVTEMSITNSVVTGPVDGYVSAGLVGGSVLLDLVSLIGAIQGGEQEFSQYMPFFGTGMTLTVTNSSTSGQVSCQFLCAGIVGISIGDLVLNGVTRTGNVGQLNTYSSDLGEGQIEDILAMIAMSGPISGGLVGASLPLSLSNGDPKLAISNSSVDGDVIGTIASGLVGVNLPAISLDLASIIALGESEGVDFGSITNLIFGALTKLFVNDALVVSNTEVNGDVLCTIACGGVSAISLGKTMLSSIEIIGDVINNNEPMIEAGHPISMCPIQITGGLVGLQLLFPLSIDTSSVSGEVSTVQAGDAPTYTLYETLESLFTGSNDVEENLLGVFCGLGSMLQGTGGTVGSFISPINITGIAEAILGYPAGGLTPFALSVSGTNNTGDVFSSGLSGTGGLVGNIFGKSTISNSSTSGTTTNTTFAEMFRTPISSAATGGLVGKMSGGYQISGNLIQLVMQIISWTSSESEFSFEALANVFEPLEITSGYAVIEGSSATGNVVSNNSAGGLVGTVTGISKIQKSYAQGSVTGVAAGGLIGSGFNMGSLLGPLNIFSTIDLENTYARGNVYTSDVQESVTFGGGLVGMMAHFGEFNISNSYSTGAVAVANGATDTRLVAGGLVGAELDMSILPYGLMTAFGQEPITRGIIDELLPALGLEVKSGVKISNSFTTSSVPAKSSGDDKLIEEIALGDPSNYKTTGSIFGFFFSLDTENFPEFPYAEEGEMMDDDALLEFITAIRWNDSGDIVDNTYYDKSVNNTTTCGSTLPSIDSFLVDILAQTNNTEDPATAEEILALLPKLVTNSDSDCTPVNTDGSQAAMFKNNKSVAPLNAWNFNASNSDTSGIWYSHAADFPTFAAGPNPPIVPPPACEICDEVENPKVLRKPFIPRIPTNPPAIGVAPVINKPITEVLNNTIDNVDADLANAAVGRSAARGNDIFTPFNAMLFILLALIIAAVVYFEMRSRRNKRKAALVAPTGGDWLKRH